MTNKKYNFTKKVIELLVEEFNEFGMEEKDFTISDNYDDDDDHLTITFRNWNTDYELFFRQGDTEDDIEINIYEDIWQKIETFDYSIKYLYIVMMNSQTY